MDLNPVVLAEEQADLRCDYCGAPARCGGETLGSIGPRRFFCVECLCAFCRDVPLPAGHDDTPSS